MNQFKTFILMFGLLAMLMFIGRLIGGTKMMWMFFLFGLGMNFITYWFSDRIILAAYRAKEVNESNAPQLYRIVRNLATVGNLPMPKVYIIENPSPNAFATGRSPQHAAVALTTGILNILSYDELEGVIGHELSHIKNRDILIATIAAAIAGAIMMISDVVKWGAIFGGFGRDRNDRDTGGGIALLVMAIIAPIIALIIQFAISRSREYIADEDGATLSRNPQKLANALRKLHYASKDIPLDASPATAHLFIVNPLSGGALLNLFSTHPPIEERIKRLEKRI